MGKLIRPPKREFFISAEAKPDFYEEIFPYSEIPAIPFDGTRVEYRLPDDIWITDTTFRDGQQARTPYTVEQIIEIYKLLSKLDGGSGVIRQSEFFLYSDKDKEAVQRVLDLGEAYPEVTGWIRAVKQDFQLVKQAGLKETGILASVSDYHIFSKLKKNRKQAIDGYVEVIKEALSNNIIPRVHFEDVTRADVYGVMVPFAQELVRLIEETNIPIKIRLCDTLGMGVPFDGAALPRSVPKLFDTIIRETGIPSKYLEWHGHNDFHKGQVNGTAAWLHGCSSVNAALLGFGERTGNTPLEAMVIEYIGITGDRKNVDTTVITDIAKYFEKELHYKIPHNYPFIGKDFNVTRAGIHADGLMKDERIYNIFDTTKLLKRPLGVVVTDKSGVAGIAYWINSYMGLQGDKKIDKRHPGIAQIYNWVLKQYEQGRTTGLSDEEMLNQTKKYIPELFVSGFDEIKNTCSLKLRRLLEEYVAKPELKSMDKREQEGVLHELLIQEPSIQWAYVAGLDGKLVARDAYQPAEQHLFKKFELDEDFSDRKWFIDPLKTGDIHVTDLYISKTTKALCITGSAPIRDDDNQIIGILGIDVKFENIAKSVESAQI